MSAGLVEESPAQFEPDPLPPPHPGFQKRLLLARAVYGLVRAIFATLSVQVENAERLLPETGGAILVTWHGRTLIPSFYLRNRGLWALISLSRDGELQNEVFRLLGFRTIRGSTGRGGIRGALRLARIAHSGGILALTPDGPRGPSHEVQPGVLLIAEKSGAPIVPVGASARRRILLKSWDRYLIPCPFTRAFVLPGEPIYVPENVGSEEREEIARRLSAALDALEGEAERRAGHAA